MPKEVTHFLIAEKVIENLEKDEFWQPFIQHRNTLLLGSVFQDCLYYLSDKYSGIKEWADRFHGDNGEDTLFLVKGLSPESLHNEHVVAFVIGMVSHIYADATFHPLVYYYTGNYFDRDARKRSTAVRNHRKIEALFDVYFCGGHKLIHSYSLERILGTGTDNLELFKQILHRIQLEDDPSIPLPGAVQLAYQRFASLQRHFNSPLTRYAHPYLELLLPAKMKELIAVFYSARSKNYLTKLSDTIHYCNPLSGHKVKTTLEALFNESVHHTLVFCQELKDILIGKKALSDLPYGPSLELGIPNCRVEDMKFFCKDEFF